MKITTSVTRIELDYDEEQILKKAIEILKDVNKVIDNDANMDYVVDSADMNLYNRIYDEIDRIEDYITMG